MAKADKKNMDKTFLVTWRVVKVKATKAVLPINPDDTKKMYSRQIIQKPSSDLLSFKIRVFKSCHF